MRRRLDARSRRGVDRRRLGFAHGVRLGSVDLVGRPGLLDLARSFGGRRLRPLDRLIEAVERATDQRPNLDLGLLALCRAAQWPAEIGSALFALGRSAGWIAHALEQRASPALLRPRARYVGPPPTL